MMNDIRLEKRTIQERLIIAKTLIETALSDLPTAEPSATLMKVEVGVDEESLRKAMQDAELTLLPAEKKGRWIPLSDGWAECSSCEHLERAAGLRWRYCPNCGARMEE